MVIVIFWNILILFLVGGYLLSRYSGSRHPELVIQTESIKSLLAATGILVGGGALTYFIIPKSGVYLGFLQLHSGWIVNQAASGNGIVAGIWRIVSFFTEVHLFGLITSCVIAGVFFYLFKELDFHQKHPLKKLLQVFGAGVVMAFFFMTVVEGLLDALNHNQSADFFTNLFIHQWLATAIPELALILLPVVFIYLFTKRITEPLDWMIHTGLSAAGFAFLFIWFELRYPGEVIDLADILFYAAGLVIYSQFAIYGFIAFKYRKQNDNWSTPLFFLSASFFYALHLQLVAEDWSIVVFFLFIPYLMFWGIFINNAVNQMKFFRYETFRSYDHARYLIVIAFSGLILANYLMNGFYSGHELATEYFMYAIAFGSPLLIFFGGYVGSIDPFKGFWRPVRIAYFDQNQDGEDQNDLSAFFLENITVPKHLVGQRVKFHAPSYNPQLLEFLSQEEGSIVNRVELLHSDGESDNDWFILKPDKPFDFNDDYEKQYVLIRMENSYSSLIHHEHIKCFLRLIPKGRNPKKHRKLIHYHKMGFIILNGGDYEY